MDLRATIHNFLDNIFSPFFTFLDMAAAKLEAAGSVTAQGLNVGQYLSVFGDMPTSFQLAIGSALISVAVLGSLLTFRSVVRIYYAVKEAIPFL